MIQPKKKINVFNSSICGNKSENQKYVLLRERFKALIESTGFAREVF